MAALASSAENPVDAAGLSCSVVGCDSAAVADSDDSAAGTGAGDGGGRFGKGSACFSFQAHVFFATAGFGGGAGGPAAGFCSNWAIRSRKDPTLRGGEVVDSSAIVKRRRY